VDLEGGGGEDGHGSGDGQTGRMNSSFLGLVCNFFSRVVFVMGDVLHCCLIYSIHPKISVILPFKFVS